MKELLFSVTRKDLRIDPYRVSGHGGQHRDKTSNAQRITHIPSGAVGTCSEYREQSRNKKEAYLRMVNSKVFQAWLKVETAKQLGTLAEIESQVDREMAKVKVEVVSADGRWIEDGR